MQTGILIADDSASVRRVIKDNLTRRSLHVCAEAEDGEEAIEKACDVKPDLIIMDLAMPKANGYVAASVLKEMLPGTPIILFTMYSEAFGRTFGARGPSFDAIVSKSDGIAKLTNCVEVLLGGTPPPT